MPRPLGWVCGSDSVDMMTTAGIFEGTRGKLHFKRTGRLLGRFPYRLVISQRDGTTSEMALEVAVKPVAARRVLAHRALGVDTSLTLTLEDGRRIDLFVNHGAGRLVNVTTTSGLY